MGVPVGDFLAMFARFQMVQDFEIYIQNSTRIFIFVAFQWTQILLIVANSMELRLYVDTHDISCFKATSADKLSTFQLERLAFRRQDKLLSTYRSLRNRSCEGHKRVLYQTQLLGQVRHLCVNTQSARTLEQIQN